jgi:hypothetical protein
LATVIPSAFPLPKKKTDFLLAADLPAVFAFAFAMCFVSPMVKTNRFYLLRFWFYPDRRDTE